MERSARPSAGRKLPSPDARAIELDALNPDGGYLYHLLLGRTYLFEGDVEQALVDLRQAAMRNAVDVETHVFLAAAFVSAASWPSGWRMQGCPDHRVGRAGARRLSTTE